MRLGTQLRVIVTRREEEPMKRLLGSLTIVALSATAAHAQMNVDFCNGSGNPAASYGAAPGQAGTWNLINGAVAGASVLGLNGVAMPGVTMTVAGTPGTATTCFNFNNAGTAGNDQALMDDLFDIGSTAGNLVTVTVNGLPAGAYSVYTYAWAPDSATLTTNVNVNATGIQTVGGAWGGTFALGVTHALHNIVIGPGQPITIVTSTTGAAGNFASFNGFQIVPEPATMGLLALGGLLGMRRRR